MNEIFMNFSYIGNQTKNPVNKQNKLDNKSFVSIDSFYRTDNKPNKNRSNIVLVGGIATLLGTAFYIYSRIKKGKVIKNKPKSVSGINENNVNAPKPDSNQLSNNLYSILREKIKTLDIQTKDFEKIFSSISDENKVFWNQSGFKIIIDNIDKLKSMLNNPIDDMSSLIKILSDKNKNLFIDIINDKEKYHVSFMEEVFEYLKNINSKNYKFISKEVLPLINKHIDKFGLEGKPLKISSFIDTITEKTKYLIDLIANAKITENEKKIKYTILKNIREDNNNIVELIINDNILADLQRIDITKILKNCKNTNFKQLETIMPNYKYLKERCIPFEDVIKLLKTENNMDVFKEIFKNARIYNIIDVLDIKMFLNVINEKNYDFVTKSLLPELIKYRKNLNLLCPDQYVDIIKAISPNTIDSIKKVADYSYKYGNNVYYVNFLAGITDENAKNIDEAMRKIKDTDLWENTCVSPLDFRKLLDEV